MKNFYFILLFCVSLFAFTFYTNKSFQTSISSQLASIIGIEITAVYDFQKMPTGGLYRDLKIGDEGNDVKIVQHALSKIVSNFSSENITGFFGEKTSDAVSEFQKLNKLSVNGVVDAQTLSMLNEIYVNELCPDGTGDNLFNNEIMINVNKNNPLPKDYIPSNLIDISKYVNTIGTICLKREVIRDLITMFESAQKDGHELVVTSGFRRPEIQNVVYKIWHNILGEKTKNEVALPYFSEHQLGTTIDLAGRSNNFIGADDNFDETKEGKWLKDNAYKFGFIMSYPENKTNKTGYIHEPWHYRYVGKNVAKEIHKKGITVEEYFASKNKNK